MAKLGFVMAGAAGHSGLVKAVIMGHVVDKVGDAMNAVKEAGQDLGQKLQTIVIEPTKIAAKKTMAFAMEVREFGASINPFNSAAKKESSPNPVRPKGMPPHVHQRKPNGP